MRIKSTGNVGIGTASPTQTLTVGTGGTVNFSNALYTQFNTVSGASAGTITGGYNTGSGPTLSGGEYTWTIGSATTYGNIVSIGLYPPGATFTWTFTARSTNGATGFTVQTVANIVIVFTSPALTSSYQTFTWTATIPSNGDTNLYFTVFGGIGKNLIWNSFSATRLDTIGTGNLGIGTTTPVTSLDVAGVISTNGLPLPYCIASGTGTFGTSYATTPAHGGSYFWYDRTSPIVIPQGANITIEIWGQSGYNQQGIAIDPYNSSSSQFNIQNTGQSGINEINATYYGTSISAVAVDNTTQNPPWTMFSMLQNTTIAYYNWQQTIKFFNPPTPSGNSRVVCGTVNGSGLHSAGNCAQFTGSIGFYSSTIAYTVTGFRILLVTTSTTTFSSTYSYRVYVS